MKFNVSVLGFCCAMLLTACGGGDPYDAGAHKTRYVAQASTFVGNITGGPSTDGTGNTIRFSSPNAVALASNKALQSDLYVGDAKLVRTVTPAGVVTTRAEIPNGAIFGMAVDTDGNLFISSYSGEIFKSSAIAPAVVTVFAGSAGTGFQNSSVPTDASFDKPKGVAIDMSDNLYIADSGNNAIRKITKNGTVSTIAGTGFKGLNNGHALQATFNQPAGIAIDTHGNLYVADTYNHVIRKIATDGLVTTIAGSGVAGYANGTGAAASFYTPQGITIDKSGNLIVADTGNHSIRTVTPQGVVTTLAGDGETSGLKNDLDWRAKFSAPMGITVGADGTFYVADSGNYMIRLLKMIWI